MPDNFVKIRGLAAALSAFGEAPDIVREEVTEATERAGDALTKQLATYPAPPPRSRYVRTGNLRRGWLNAKPIVRDGGGRFATGSSIVMVTYSNPVTYTPYVQGDTRQAWMHQGRWDTIGTVQERNEARVRGELETAVRRAALRITTEAGSG